MYRNLLLCFICAIANLTYAKLGEADSAVDAHWGCGTPTLMCEHASRRPVAAAPQQPHLPAAPAPEPEVHVGKTEQPVSLSVRTSISISKPRSNT